MSDGTIREGEHHPAADSALKYLYGLGPLRLLMWQEAFASTSLSGKNNRTAQICTETMHRILNAQPVSDRYVLGLAWTVKEMEEQSGENTFNG